MHCRSSTHLLWLLPQIEVFQAGLQTWSYSNSSLLELVIPFTRSSSCLLGCLAHDLSSSLRWISRNAFSSCVDSSLSFLIVSVPFWFLPVIILSCSPTPLLLFSLLSVSPLFRFCLDTTLSGLSYPLSILTDSVVHTLLPSRMTSDKRSSINRHSLPRPSNSHRETSCGGTHTQCSYEYVNQIVSWRWSFSWTLPVKSSTISITVRFSLLILNTFQLVDGMSLV